jgi:tetratricopeptide (TPR) repeat protein
MSNGKASDRFVADLNKAIALHQQNQLSEAEPIYRQLLRANPSHFDVVHLLGTLLRRTGQLAESQALLDRAVSMRPQSAAAQLNRANTLVDRRSFSEAVAGFSRAIALKPDYAEAHNGRAMARLELGEAEAARADAEMALKLKPGYWEAAFTLAMSLAALDRLADACRIYLGLLAQRPASPGVLLELGRLLRREKDGGRAIEVLSRARQLDPNSVAIGFELALALRDRGSTREALTVLERVLALDAGMAQAHGLRGDLLREQGRLDDALASYEESLRLAPGSPQANTGRGHVLSELGRGGEAYASYEAALAGGSHHASAYYGLSRLRRFRPDDPLIMKMREAAAQPRLSEDERSELSFALAKAFEDSGDLAACFAALRDANALRKKVLAYDFAQDDRLFEELTSAAPRLIEAGAGLAAVGGGPAPLFIVGMPRSGTTLLEQILSAGPDVQGAGELNFVKQFGIDLATGRTPATAAALRTFAADYLAAIAPLSAGRPWVSDKMPLNFRFVPLICAALPQARILHIRRDARAVCWSNFKHYFGSRTLGFAYDLDDLVRYYRLYSNMMQDWNRLCGARVLNIDYERLTANPEVEIRQIISDLSLPWHDAYLAPQDNDRVVRTASADQVRQAVYRGSSDAWRAFSPFIGSAFDGLDGL